MEMKEDLETVLTTNQVAEYCRVQHEAVLRWISEGKLKSSEASADGCMVRKVDFVNFLQEHALPVPPELVEDNQTRLLIVDNSVEIVEILKDLLSEIDGLEIQTAFNGYEAGIKMETFRPHIMILDIWMPGVNGFEVCKHLKFNPETANIKIMAITGHPCHETVKKINNAGADFLFEKPIDTIHLKNIIEEMIGKKN